MSEPTIELRVTLTPEDYEVLTRYSTKECACSEVGRLVGREAHVILCKPCQARALGNGIKAFVERVKAT